MKTQARQLYEVVLHKKHLIDVAKAKARTVDTCSRQTVWTLEDNSTISLDNYGGLKVDGKFVP